MPPRRRSRSWACAFATGSASARGSTRTAWRSRLGRARVRLRRARHGHAARRSRATRRPRLFRLADDGALDQPHGLQQRRSRCARRAASRDARPSLPDGFVIGVNIGRNRDTPDERAGRRLRGRRPVGGRRRRLPRRQRQQPEHAGAARPPGPGAPGRAARGRPRRGPAAADLLVKVSPDLGAGQLRHAARACSPIPRRRRRDPVEHDDAARLGLALAQRASEEGGLSGRPLRQRMDAAVGRARALVGSRLAIIASGGSAPTPRRAGGRGPCPAVDRMVYDGPGLIGEAVRAERRRDDHVHDSSTFYAADT